MIRGLHHAQVTVPSQRLEEARHFYGEVLGLSAKPRPTGEGWGANGLWFTVGDREIHIGVEDGVERFPTRAHVAYEVNDLQVMLKRLREQGLHCQTDEEPGVPIIPGWRRFQTRDPFGNQIEFIARASLATPINNSAGRR